jgi:hypothetical protein
MITATIITSNITGVVTMIIAPVRVSIRTFAKCSMCNARNATAEAKSSSKGVHIAPAATALELSMSL